MTTETIRFNDGAAYERTMGVWSRLAGDVFVDWLAAAPGQRWVDVGCGSGAFSQLVVDRCAPSVVEGIDPSEAQLAFARTRPAASVARFQLGDAMDLPFPDDAFDVAVMALVIFFVPEPARGVAEMARVVRPGGTVAAYGWDLLGGGFPNAPILEELQALGVETPQAPRAEASGLEALNSYWMNAGLDSVETREITVARTYERFEDFWATLESSASISPALTSLTAADLAILRDRLSARLPADSAGRITYSARANAVRGRVVR